MKRSTIKEANSCPEHTRDSDDINYNHRHCINENINPTCPSVFEHSCLEQVTKKNGKRMHVYQESFIKLVFQSILDRHCGLHKDPHTVWLNFYQIPIHSHLMLNIQTN